MAIFQLVDIMASYCEYGLHRYEQEGATYYGSVGMLWIRKSKETNHRNM